LAKIKRATPGDVVCMVWKDHYRVHNRSMGGGPMLVESFGRVAEHTDEGIALLQNRVTNHQEIGAEECMDGQFVLDCDIVSIEVIA